MDNELRQQLLELVTRLQRQCGQLQGDLVALQDQILSHATDGTRPPPEPRTQIERVAAHIYQQRPRSVTTEELSERFPEINVNSRGSVLRTLRMRGQIDSVGRGGYRWAGTPTRSATESETRSR